MHFVLTGTGANVLALRTLLAPGEAAAQVITVDHAEDDGPA